MAVAGLGTAVADHDLAVVEGAGIDLHASTATASSNATVSSAMHRLNIQHVDAGLDRQRSFEAALWLTPMHR